MVFIGSITDSQFNTHSKQNHLTSKISGFCMHNLSELKSTANMQEARRRNEILIS